MNDRNENTFSIGELTLVSGVGDYANAQACVMSAAAAIYWMGKGDPLAEATDRLDCACPVVRKLCIARNDGPWSSDEERTRWGRGIIPRIIGSRGDREETLRRAFRCADVAVREIAGVDCAPIVDRETALLGKSAAATYAAQAASSAAAAQAAYAAATTAAAATAAAADAYAVATTAAAATAATAPAAYADSANAWKRIESLIEEFLGLDNAKLTVAEKAMLNEALELPNGASK